MEHGNEKAPALQNNLKRQVTKDTINATMIVTEIDTSVMDNELDIYADIVDAPSYQRKKRVSTPKQTWRRKVR